MFGKRKRPSTRRNVVLVLLFLVVIAGLVAAAGLMQRNRVAVLLFPEEHEARVAKMQSPDNAMLFLADAIKALPPKPGNSPAYAPPEWWSLRSRSQDEFFGDSGEPDFALFDEPGLAKLCWVDLPEDDPALADYIEACQPAWDLVKLALSKNTCVAQEPSRFQSQTYDEKMMQLGRCLVALGRQRFDAEPTLEALSPLLDAVRMVRMLTRENDMYHIAQAIEAPAWQQLRALSEKGAEPLLLQDAMMETMIGYLPRHDVLHTLLLETDNLIARQPKPPSLRTDYGVFRMVYFTEVQRIILLLKDRHEELQQVADLAPPKMREWLAANVHRKRGPADASRVASDIFWGLHRAAEISSDFAATLLALALEVYKKQEGRYPDKLEDLVPGYYDTLPGDPYTLLHLGYRPRENGYTIYSFGANLADDGANALRDRIIVDIQKAAAPQPEAVDAQVTPSN